MRHIEAGIGSMGERLSTWVDHLLQPFLAQLPGMIQDTKDVISKLECIQCVCWGCIWLSCDVIGLYPVIPLDFIDIICPTEHLEKYITYQSNVNRYIVRVVEFLLELNFFMFE